MLNHSYFVEPTKEEMAIVEKLLKTIYRKCGVDARCEKCKFYEERNDHAREGLTGYCSRHGMYVRSDGYCGKGAWNMKHLFTDGGEKDG